ncbi:HNH endonuclease [Rhodococcus sp. G-MC3]|uniref:HNH endonuclease n=1 Tax=Rhodococcus sp. G-MC3 TaxID=3046209 RepID=UPI0024B8BACA|nr:HNH endonuclease [Rhodococcus sp. G-MC3]MDJ0395914.1 HNH endonuclease [Rhodococcus sp. G-MC3]
MSDSVTSSDMYDKDLPYTVDANGCHRLSLTATDRNGYGVIKHRGKNYYAHRFQWLKLRGEIPDNMEVMHSRGCSRDCINVHEHLSLGTHQQNIDQIKQDAKQFCAVGHELNRTNSYSFNHRVLCKICKSELAAVFGGTEKEDKNE